MRLADEILLLLTDDATGAPSADPAAIERVLAAAVLVDLQDAGLATLADVEGLAPDGSGLVVDAGDICLTPDSFDEHDDVTAAAVTTFRSLQGRPLEDTLAALGRGLLPVVHHAMHRSVHPAPALAGAAAPALCGDEAHARSILRRVLTSTAGAGARPTATHATEVASVTGEERRHARIVVTLLTAAGLLDIALPELAPAARRVAARTDAPVDAPSVLCVVLRELRSTRERP